MTDPIPPAPTSLDARDDREAWRALVRHLGEFVPGARPVEDVDGFIDGLMRRHPRRDRAGRVAALEDLAARMGLSVNWRTSRMSDVGRMLVPDEVAVAWSGDGWVSVRRPLLRVHVERGPWSTDPDGVTAWAGLASAWPAASLAAGHDTSPWRRLFRLLGAERRDVGLVIAYGVAAALLALATPVAVQVLVNTIAFGSFRQPLVALSLLLFGSLAFAAVLNVLQRVVVESLQRRLLARVADDLSLRLPRMRVSAFDQHPAPELVNRFFDVITVQKSLAILMLDGLAASVSAVVGLGLLAVYHPALLGFDVLLLTAVGVVLFGFGVGGPEAAVLESKRKYALAEWLEIVSARPDLFKHDGAGALAARRTTSATRAWLQARDEHFRIVIRQIAGAYGLQAIATTALLGIGGWLVLDGQLTLGQLVAAEIVVASALGGMVRFAGKLETLYDLLAGVDKLGHLLDVPLDPPGPSRGEPGTDPLKLEVQGVTLPRREGSIRFTVPAGRAVEIGVSDPLARRHLADLMVLARDAGTGSIQVDDTDVRDAPRAALQDRVCLVRDIRPLPVSLRDNLALGREDIDDGALRAALLAFGLEDLSQRLPEGLDTPLRPDDTRLRHEELIRLALVRAVVGRPRLLVLDGLLDGLKTAEQDELLRTLCGAAGHWTLIHLTGQSDDARPRPIGPGPDRRVA